MTSQQRSNDVENQVSHYLTPSDLFGTLNYIAERCIVVKYTSWNSVCSTPLASYDITTEKQWRWKSSIPLFDALWFILRLSTALHNCAYCDIYEWNSVCSHTICKLWHHNREAMTSKIKYPTIWRPLIYSVLSTALLQLCIVVTYTSWNSVCSTPLASYDISNREAMTSKIKYPTIWRPLIYSGLSTALHNCA